MIPRNAAHPIDLIDAIREISRSAHRWRDRASARYEVSHFKGATTAKHKKEACYSLKERGIVAAHQQGLLRYIGASPQGLGVYEYGDGGRACFHSTLHPVGAVRTPVPDHPEVLLVPAKKQRLRICDAELTLSSLDVPTQWGQYFGYERSSRPCVPGTMKTTGREYDGDGWDDDEEDEYFTTWDYDNGPPIITGSPVR
jgi:hypothetical protein